jgi:hypothetical protein
VSQNEPDPSIRHTMSQLDTIPSIGHHISNADPSIPTTDQPTLTPGSNTNNTAQNRTNTPQKSQYLAFHGSTLFQAFKRRQCIDKTIHFFLTMDHASASTNTQPSAANCSMHMPRVFSTFMTYLSYQLKLQLPHSWHYITKRTPLLSLKF